MDGLWVLPPPLTGLFNPCKNMAWPEEKAGDREDGVVGSGPSTLRPSLAFTPRHTRPECELVSLSALLGTLERGCQSPQPVVNPYGVLGPVLRLTTTAAPSPSACPSDPTADVGAWGSWSNSSDLAKVTLITSSGF